MSSAAAGYVRSMSLGLSHLECLRCPRTGAPLLFHEDTKELVGPASAYPIELHGASAYVNFLKTSNAPEDRTREAQRAVYDTPTSRYAKQGHQDKQRFMRVFVERRLAGRVKSKDALLLDAMKRCKVGPAAMALEIGCNDGRYLNTFTALHGCGGVGIDLSEHAVRQALDARPASSRNDFHVSDANPLPFADESFDAILSFDVFEHLGHPSVARTMHECRRVLRPGGRLLVYIVSQKDEFTLHETLRQISGGRVGVDDGEGHAYENFVHPDSFRSMAEEADLEVTRLRAFHGFWTLFAEEMLANAPPAFVYRLFSLLDYPLTRYEHGNGFLAEARRR